MTEEHGEQESLTAECISDTIVGKSARQWGAATPLNQSTFFLLQVNALHPGQYEKRETETLEL